MGGMIGDIAQYLGLFAITAILVLPWVLPSVVALWVASYRRVPDRTVIYVLAVLGFCVPLIGVAGIIAACVMQGGSQLPAKGVFVGGRAYGLLPKRPTRRLLVVLLVVLAIMTCLAVYVTLKCLG